MKREIIFKRSLIIFQVGAAFLFIPVACAAAETKSAVDKKAAVVEKISPPVNTYSENFRRWQNFSEAERQKIREKARRLTPQRLRRLKEESRRLREMPPEEREKIRINYQRFNQLPPEKRKALKERFQRFERLAPEKREEFRNQFRKGTNGPAVGLGMGQGPGNGQGQGINRQGGPGGGQGQGPDQRSQYGKNNPQGGQSRSSEISK